MIIDYLMNNLWHVHCSVADFIYDIIIFPFIQLTKI